MAEETRFPTTLYILRLQHPDKVAFLPFRLLLHAQQVVPGLEKITL
ncbi:hypothetical protein [Pontibacter pamirensis]|nr:hypothetical protein [Pontibacter pamirensis]